MLKWSPKVPQSLVRRFYVNAATGIEDDELIDELGYALYFRCRSILQVTRAVKGELDCPECRSPIFHRSRKDESLVCPKCGWSVTWGDVQKSYRNRQLFGGAALPFFQEYYDKYPSASDSRARSLLIDRLVHQFHWNLVGGMSKATRPAACCLIEAKGPGDIIRFLDELAGVDSDDPERQQTIREWVQAKSSSG